MRAKILVLIFAAIHSFFLQPIRSPSEVGVGPTICPSRPRISQKMLCYICGICPGHRLKTGELRIPELTIPG